MYDYFFFCITLATIHDQYIEVIQIKEQINNRTYIVRLIDQMGKTKDVTLMVEKPIKVKIFTRATVVYAFTKDNSEWYRLIYTEPNQRKPTWPIGKCSWGQELIQ